tara:strand:+ start:177 stop:632 length:456 start_codon:yes stop_codon:yes gene_type:complete
LLKFIFVVAIASIASAQASEYKKMICEFSDADWNHIAEYEEGLLYDEIKQNFYDVGVLHKRNCSTKPLTSFGAMEFKGIDYSKAHKKSCSIQGGVFFSSSTRKSARGHTLITEIKINFLTKRSSYNRWVCQPGQKECPNEFGLNSLCRYAE